MVQEPPKLVLPSGQQIAMQILREISDMRNAIQQLVPSGMGEDYQIVMNVPGDGSTNQEVRIEPPGQIGYVYMPNIPAAATIWGQSVGGDLIATVASGQSVHLQLPANQSVVVKFSAAFTTTFTYWVASRPIEIEETAPVDASGVPYVTIIGGTNGTGSPVLIRPVTPTTLTYASGTIAAGGTSQAISLSNTNRIAVIIQNPIANGLSLWIRFNGVAATADRDSIEIAAGGYWESPPFAPPVGGIAIIAATTGHTFHAEGYYA